MKNTEIDEQGDVIFRFRLPSPPAAKEYSLEEHYRRAILHLLRIVRLTHRGRPLLIDGFAFQNQPDRTLSLLPQTAEAPAERVE